MNPTLILLCACGLLLHFLGRLSEHIRLKGKIGPIAYLRQDVPGWLSALIGSVACMAMLDSLPAMLGLGPVVSGGGLMQVAAFCAGYMGSSIAAKVPSLISGKGIR